MLLTWLIHFLDEWWFGFPLWATRHFAPLPGAMWLPGMFVLTVLVAAIAGAAATPRAPCGAAIAACVIQSIFAWNGLFHAATTLWFGEYSPGMASGLFVGLPLTVVVYRGAANDPRLDGRPRRVAFWLGCVLHAVVVATLFVDKSALG
ncbi:MAG: HXXEE domain-containing protein [bacterium]|nr:HXXEE domain-containing protein [bacterium]